MPRIKIDSFMERARRIMATTGHPGNTIFVSSTLRHYDHLPSQMELVYQISFFMGTDGGGGCFSAEGKSMTEALFYMQNEIKRINNTPIEEKQFIREYPISDEF